MRQRLQKKRERERERTSSSCPWRKSRTCGMHRRRGCRSSIGRAEKWSPLGSRYHSSSRTRGPSWSHWCSRRSRPAALRASPGLLWPPLPHTMERWQEIEQARLASTSPLTISYTIWCKKRRVVIFSSSLGSLRSKGVFVIASTSMGWCVG